MQDNLNTPEVKEEINFTHLVLLAFLQITLLIASFFSSLVIWGEPNLFVCAAFLLPLVVYHIPKNKICSLKEGVIYTLFLFLPTMFVVTILFLLSLLISPLGLMMIPLVLKTFGIALGIIFGGFYIVNIIVVVLKPVLRQLFVKLKIHVD